MQRLQVCLVFSFLIFGISRISAQVFIDPGVGVVWRKSGGSPRPLVNMGVHNLIFNRFGFYGTVELSARNGDNGPFQMQRDVVGGIVRLNSFISFFGGAGVFSDGLIARGFKPQEVRKEAGLMFNIPKAHLNLDLGYSNTAGFSFLAGIIIPFKKAEIKNPVREHTMPVLPAEPVAKVFENRLPGPKKSDSLQIVSPPSEQPKVESKPVSDQVQITQEEIRSRVIENPEPVVEPVVQVKAKLPDGIEVFTSGFYAVNGVYRLQNFALASLDDLHTKGFTASGISIEKATGLYYVWVLKSDKNEIVKDFVLKNRTRESLGGLWVLRVK